MIAADSLILLDTSVVVNLVRWNAIGQRIDGDHGLLTRKDRPLVSIVTAGEMGSLAQKFDWRGAKRQRMQEILLDLVLVPVVQGRLVAAYGEIDHFSERIHQPARPMGKNDLWIAATANITGATLLTSDADFDHLAPRFFHLVRVDGNSGETVFEK